MIPMPTILQGDARALPLPDASVDLVATSPPFFGLRSYQDDGAHYAGQIGSEPTPAEFLDALIDCTHEMVRVLKPTGSIFVNLGDKYAGANATRPRGWEGRGLDTAGRVIPGAHRTGLRGKSLIGIPWRYALRCIDDLRLILRAEIIWSKPNGLPESVTDRVRRSHEQWFHFVLQPRYYSSTDEIRETCQPDSFRVTKKGVRSFGGRDASLYHSPSPYNGPSPLGKLPGSVWEVASQPLVVPPEIGVDHFAAFPMEWPRRLIKGWSPPTGTVLDPFGGTGTTALVATMLGRRGITVDASHDYCRLARWRAGDPKERARAAGIDASKIERPAPGQGDLFTLGGEAS